MFATAIIVAAAATAPVLQRLPHANLSLLFMTGVLIVAVRHGLWPSIYASVLGFLIFNFFFTTPLYTLEISEEGDVATLLFFLVMAILSGNLASRMRDAMAKREHATRRTEALQTLTRDVAGAASREQVLQILADRLGQTFGCAAVAATIGRGDAIASAASRNPPAGRRPAPRELLRGTDKIAGWSMLPLNTVRGRVGRVAINQNALTRDEREYAVALADQATVALERIMLVADLEETKLVSEREQLRAALLSSVSHDLRTPLASIIGAASSLAAYDATLTREARDTLLGSVIEEAERLDRYIQNLLDMTRLAHGEPELQCDWEDLRDLVSAATRRLRLGERGFAVAMDVVEDAQLVRVHGDLIEQALVNLLDNAARYSPPGGRIGIAARQDGDLVLIEVSDEGPGIPEEDRERVFDPFFVREGDRTRGTGLGLSICRGIARAHGGDASALSAANGRGALLRLGILKDGHAAHKYDDNGREAGDNPAD